MVFSTSFVPLPCSAMNSCFSYHLFTAYMPVKSFLVGLHIFHQIQFQVSLLSPQSHLYTAAPGSPTPASTSHTSFICLIHFGTPCFSRSKASCPLCFLGWTFLEKPALPNPSSLQATSYRILPSRFSQGLKLARMKSRVMVLLFAFLPPFIPTSHGHCNAGYL